MALPALEVRITADPTQASAGFRKIEQSQRSLEQATEQYRASLARLTAAESQGLVGKQTLAKAISEIEREYQQAAQTAAKYVGATATMGKASVAAAGQVTAMGNSMAMANASTTNLMFQFQDIGMMLAAGQSPLMLAMQQGTQVSGVFHQMQQNGQSAFSGIVGGLRAMINPMSLLTIGTIAAGAALFQWGRSALGASSDALTLNDAMESLSDIASDMNTSIGILQTSNYVLAEQYGMLAGRVRELAMEELQLAEIRARNLIQEEISSVGDLGIAYRGALRSGHAYRNAMASINKDFGLTGAAAENLAAAMGLVTSSKTPDEYVDAMNYLREVLDENNVALSEIPLELQEAIGRANGLEQALINVAAAASNAAAAGADMAASLPMTTGVGLTVGDGNLLPPSVQASGGPVRSGGGGGGVARENPLLREFEAMREGLMSEEELQIESFERQQEALQYALDQRLVTTTEHNNMLETAQRQHQDAMAAIDVYRYGTGVQKTKAFMGDMASALQGGNEEMLRISKVFGAAQALISAWEGAAKALTLPFPQNIAAFSSVLAQGMGAVSAIQGVSSSGGGAASTGSSGVTAASTVTQEIIQRREVSINLQGGSTGDQSMIRDLISQINEALGDGASLSLQGA